MYDAYMGEVARIVPRRAKNLKRSLQTMLRSLEETRGRLQEHAQALSQRGEREDAAYARKLLRRLTKDIERLEEELRALDAEDRARQEALAEQPDSVDYSKYRVDSSVAHTIEEDLSNLRPVSYGFLGERNEAGTWKQILIEVCGMLNRQDPILFSSLDGDPDLMGKRRPKLSADPARLVDPARIPDARMYVETHLNMRQYCGILRTLLGKFGIPSSELCFYVERDYTPLRAERKAKKSSAEPPSGQNRGGEEIEGQLRLSFEE